MDEPMTADRRAEILESHKRWLAGATDADAYRADLRGANLRHAHLRNANLLRANLRDANLRGADLCRADFRGADLSGADLSGTEVRGTNLRYAHFRGANLCAAKVEGANLDGTGIAIIAAGQWRVWVDPDRAVIGCQSHPHAVWRSLDRATADRWYEGAWEWWQAWGPTVLAACDACARHGWPNWGHPWERIAMDEGATVVVMHGRSIGGILADVSDRAAEIGIPANADRIVITRDGDDLPPPDGVNAVAVSDWRPIVGRSYIVVTNGGTTDQLAPVLLRLAAGYSYSAWSIHRDGSRRLWPESTR